MSQSPKVKHHKKWMQTTLFMIVLVQALIGSVVLQAYYVSPLKSKKEELVGIQQKIADHEKNIDSLIFEYNKEDGFQKIRLNDKGNVEYYDIKVKSLSFDELRQGVEWAATQNEISPVDEEKTEHVSLESYYATEIPPELYKEVKYLVEQTTDKDFKKLVEHFMEDGKISYGEYQKMSIPLAIISKEVELTKTKRELLKNLK